jgi:cell division protein FtsN
MARDYAKRPKRKMERKTSRKPVSRKRASVAPWTWLVTGLLMGLVIAAIAYLKITVLPGSGTDNIPAQAKATPQKQKKASAQKTAAKTPPPPKFDFYTLLPEMEVAVSEPLKPKPAPVQTAHSDEDLVLPHPLEQAKYRLQIASFKRYEEADTLKAKLAMTGHMVEIHSIKLDNGTVWYRVYTRVLPNREQAVSLQKELQNQAISSMLLKAS